MKRKPIHHYVPKWMTEELEDRKCCRCEQDIRKEDIIAIGIRETKKRDKTIYMEHQCSACEFREITSCGGHKVGTLDEMCYILLEEVQRKKSMEKAKGLQKSKTNKPWTDKEVEEFKQFMSKCISHEQFMKHIRASQYMKGQSKDDEKPSTED